MRNKDPSEYIREKAERLIDNKKVVKVEEGASADVFQVEGDSGDHEVIWNKYSGEVSCDCEYIGCACSHAWAVWRLIELFGRG